MKQKILYNQSKRRVYQLSATWQSSRLKTNEGSLYCTLVEKSDKTDFLKHKPYSLTVHTFCYILTPDPPALYQWYEHQ